jgi:hypothetical protein
MHIACSDDYAAFAAGAGRLDVPDPAVFPHVIG